ncbi:MAG: type II secretion system F family protein [Planctomycetes bacterium]|nr:type II secretion system F family protein [Planctomycetota bacterium]
MFKSRISLKTLAILCKSLATMLHSGVPLLKTLEIASRKTGDAKCRRTLATIRDEIRQGTDMSEAMAQQQGYFPELTIDMVSVGERTGALPEVLEGLAGHYENINRLWRMLIGLIAWPLFQLVAAIFIVGFVILVLGWIAPTPTPGQPAHDILGLGLTGTSGAIKWFALSFGSIFGVVAIYYIGGTVFRSKRFFDALLMKIPVVGSCLRSFAIARFSWCYAVTQQTGMPIQHSLELSLKATGNGAFMGASAAVCEAVMNGEELSTALDDTRLFPEEYVSLVQVGETSGTVPETLQRLSPQFEEQARRSLVVLAVSVSWLVWLLVAGLIAFIVISFVLQYVKMINDAMKI